MNKIIEDLGKIGIVPVIKIDDARMLNLWQML